VVNLSKTAALALTNRIWCFAGKSNLLVNNQLIKYLLYVRLNCLSIFLPKRVDLSKFYSRF
jgi:hypothetical protein